MDIMGTRTADSHRYCITLFDINAIFYNVDFVLLYINCEAYGMVGVWYCIKVYYYAAQKIAPYDMYLCKEGLVTKQLWFRDENLNYSFYNSIKPQPFT